MKVLIFSTYFLPIVGGVQTCVLLLAKGIAAFPANQEGDGRNEVTVVTETPRDTMDDSVLPFPVVRQPKWNELRALIRDADVVHIAGPSLMPMALSWASTKPYFIEHHVYQAICPNGLLFLQPQKEPCRGYFSLRRYDRCLQCRSAEVGGLRGLRSILLGFPRAWLCSRAAANIAVSEHVRQRISMPRMKTIYHGIESGPAASPANRTVSSAGALQVAFAGRLVAEKGLDVLLRAARLLRDEGIAFHLKIIGDGPERDRLAALTRDYELDERVSFLGRLSGPDLEAALRDVSVVVMASIWEETAGLSAMEQMMRGGVVVAADIGGLGEVVGEAGLKFPPGDAQGLAAQLRRLAGNASLRQSLGSAARARAESLFKLDSMVQAHISLYNETLKASPRRFNRESVV